MGRQAALVASPDLSFVTDCPRKQRRTAPVSQGTEDPVPDRTHFAIFKLQDRRIGEVCVAKKRRTTDFLALIL